MPLGQICLAVHISQLAKLFSAFLISVVHSDHSHRAILCSYRCPVSSASLQAEHTIQVCFHLNCLNSSTFSVGMQNLWSWFSPALSNSVFHSISRVFLFPVETTIYFNLFVFSLQSSEVREWFFFKRKLWKLLEKIINSFHLHF